MLVEEMFQKCAQTGFGKTLEETEVVVPVIPLKLDAGASSSGAAASEASLLSELENTSWLLTGNGCDSKSLVEVNRPAEKSATANEVLERLRAPTADYSAPRNFFSRPRALQNTVALAMRRGLARTDQEVLVADSSYAAALVGGSAPKLARISSKPSLAALVRNLSEPGGGRWEKGC